MHRQNTDCKPSRSGSDPREYWYFPVVKDDEHIRLGKAKKKTVDAPGYHDAEISPAYPDNVATPWRTTDLQGHDGVGIVVLKEDEAGEPVRDSARIYWLPSDLANSNARVVSVSIPPFYSLPRFSIDEVMEAMTIEPGDDAP